ncbi:MAG: hypothetical protein ACRD9R_20865 [Pyrinomonadaceae bacterium]
MPVTTIAIGGFSSNSGKTTLLCELLRRLGPGWEAIKTTRGHYRSCGKDARTCCVSHLLSDEPLVRTGRAGTDAPGKDTGHYWDAGAENVHWVVATDAQVEPGIRAALARVKAAGVLVEGNSFTEYVPVDFFVIAARASGGKIKPTARRALTRTDAIYLFDDLNVGPVAARAQFDAWAANSPERELLSPIPVYTANELPQLAGRVRAALEGAVAVA